MGTPSVQRVSLGNDAPLVGCELNPYVLARKPDGTHTAEDLTVNNPADGFALRVRWLRSPKSERNAMCTFHQNKPALLVNLIFKTTHCSQKCFTDTWPQLRSQGAPKQQTTPGGEESAWREVGTGRSYTPSESDIGHTLMFEVTPVAASSNAELGPPKRLHTGQVSPIPDTPTRRQINISANAPQKECFSVLSYNLLADIYASEEMYGYCPRWVLSWPYRRRQLMREIKEYDADVLTLQEVQSDHFENFFRPELERAGYEAAQKQKSGTVFTGSGYATEGCAIFYKTSKFRQRGKYEMEFSDAASLPSDSAGIPREGLQRLLKDNVALVVVLESLVATLPSGSPRQLCVANTHIHANPDHNDVKLWQINTLLQGLQKLSRLPVVLGGDFNSVPGSAAYEFIVNGRVPAGHPELNCDPLGILSHAKLSHDLLLQSAYASVSSTDSSRSSDRSSLAEEQSKLDSRRGEPGFTNFTGGFEGTLDYIFFTPNKIAPVGILSLPARGELSDKLSSGASNGCLPNSRWVSDHVAIRADFRFL